MTFIEVKNYLRSCPLYKQRGKQETFLGISKSKHPKWCGWNYIKELKRQNRFPQDLVDCGLYELALNFWELYSLTHNITTEEIDKSYSF